MSTKNAATITQGRFYWHELKTSEPTRSQGFYGELFGWKSRSMDMGPMGDYTVLSAGDQDVGGIASGKEGQADHWLAYCTVTDVDKAVELAKKQGAVVETEAVEIPTVGRFAILRDPEGARLAPFRPHEERAETAERPGLGSFCWHELVSQDPAASERFYRAVYGFDAESKDMGPMGSYTLLKRGEKQAGGIMKAQKPGAPSMWLGYVVVEDIDKSLAKAKRFKAETLLTPTEIPGIGRFAVIAAPGGSTIALFVG